MKPLRIALTKGRLEKTTIELFQKIGYNCDEVGKRRSAFGFVRKQTATTAQMTTVKPVLDENKDILGMKAEINV